MRTFYAFCINDFYFDMYNKHSYQLYKILEDIYYTKNYDKFNSYRLYKQVVNTINKMLCNGYITKNHRLSYEYSCDNNTHFIKKKEEHSKMVISNVNIKIISDVNYPSFFDDINNYASNVFVCDFDNKDYFWLDKVVKTYRQKEVVSVQ